MKKFTALFLALVCVFGLVGCATEKHENNTSSSQENIADKQDDVPTETTEDLSEIPGGTLFIIEIRDRAEEEQLPCTEAEELFYEDETTKYCYEMTFVK